MRKPALRIVSFGWASFQPALTRVIKKAEDRSPASPLLLPEKDANLAVKIERELVRRRAEAHRVKFNLPLVSNIGFE